LHYPVPGGIALVKLDAAAKRNTVQFDGQRVLTQQINGEWYAVVGLSLTTKPATYKITYRVSDKTISESFRVYPKDYETQHITIKDKRKVEPNAEDLKRINKESKIIRSSLAKWTDIDNVPLDFAVPVQGRMSSPFGLRRFFNGQPRNPHSGLDIAAAEGTPIQSPAPGIVITTGNYFFNGNTVFLDHGQGLISMFCHLNKIYVKPGQSIAKGEQIGEVGMTGRVTGPHLHWSISLNNARIEPRLLLGPAYRNELTAIQK
jgi:murein DD-endopeptidase MepM/ murein hydrolase activator NlpD